MADTIVVANQSIQGEYMANVLCFSNITNNDVNFQIFADNFRASWVNFAGFRQATEWSLDSLTFQIIDATNVLYSVEIAFTSGALSGGNTGQTYATQTALLVSTTNRGTKPNRGRIYLGGMTESNAGNSVWNNDVLADAQTMVEEWRDGINDGNGDCFLRILRRPSAKFPTYISSGVTSVIPRQRPATIRGRRVTG